MNKVKRRMNSLTRSQLSLFWRAFSAACFNLGYVDRDVQENYRREVLRSETGKESLKELNRTSDFDAVLRRFYADAGDWRKASEAAVQDAKRMGYLIKVACLQLMQLKGGDPLAARDYLGGILDRAKIPNGVGDGDCFWLDLSFSSAHSVFAMLDTHRRRLLASWPSASSFSPGVRYQISGPILERQAVDSDYYTSIPFTVRWRGC